MSFGTPTNPTDAAVGAAVANAQTASQPPPPTAVTPEPVTAPAAEQAPYVPTVPGINEQELAIQMAADNLATRMMQLERQIEEVKGTGNVTPTQSAAISAAAAGDEPLPPELANDPAMRRLLKLEQNLNNLMGLTTKLTSQYETQQQQAVQAQRNYQLQQIKAAETDNVKRWVEANLIDRDPEVAANKEAGIASLIRREADRWIENNLDPSSDLRNQYAQFQVDMANYIKFVKSAINPLTSKREVVQVAQQAAANNFTSGATGRPAPDPSPLTAAGRNAKPGSPVAIAQMMKDVAARMGIS